LPWSARRSNLHGEPRPTPPPHRRRSGHVASFAAALAIATGQSGVRGVDQP